MADIVIQLGIGVVTGIAAGAAASGVGNALRKRDEKKKKKDALPIRGSKIRKYIAKVVDGLRPEASKMGATVAVVAVWREKKIENFDLLVYRAGPQMLLKAGHHKGMRWQAVLIAHTTPGLYQIATDARNAAQDKVKASHAAVGVVDMRNPSVKYRPILIAQSQLAAGAGNKWLVGSFLVPHSPNMPITWYHKEKAFRDKVPPEWGHFNGDQWDPSHAAEPDDHTGDSDAGEYPMVTPEANPAPLPSYQSAAPAPSYDSHAAKQPAPMPTMAPAPVPAPAAEQQMYYAPMYAAPPTDGSVPPGGYYYYPMQPGQPGQPMMVMLPAQPGQSTPAPASGHQVVVMQPHGGGH